MSVSDLHPEDLLDREARGTLPPKERAMLDAHLSHCSACRLEREVRADFADEMGEDALVHDGSLLVTRVLERTDPPPPAPVPVVETRAGEEPRVEPAALAPRARSPRRLRIGILIAAALTLASVAGASRLTGVFTIHDGDSASAPVTTVPAALPVAAPRGQPSVAPHVAPQADAPAALVTSVPEPSPEPAAPSAPTAVPAPRPRSPVLAATALQNTPSTILPVVAMTPAPDAADDATAAPALFADANAARRRGEHGRAAALYRDLLTRHPVAAEASATRVALGRLLLDDGDAAGALPLFEAYLSNGDPALREEAMVGRARSLGRLGRAGDERGAWTALLHGYPQSIHAARAHARLEELGDR